MNKYIKKYKTNQKGGTVILITMVILSGILFVSLTAGDLVMNSLRLGRSQIHSTKAYFAAEAGAERMLWEIRKEGIIRSGLITCNDGDLICFDAESDGSVTDCDDPPVCPGGEFDYQILSNNSIYSLEYGFTADVPLDTIAIYSTGSYVDPRDANSFVNRVIKVEYLD